jgi:hypothetical protein
MTFNDLQMTLKPKNDGTTESEMKNASKIAKHGLTKS